VVVHAGDPDVLAGRDAPAVLGRYAGRRAFDLRTRRRCGRAILRRAYERRVSVHSDRVRSACRRWSREATKSAFGRCRAARRCRRRGPRVDRRRLQSCHRLTCGTYRIRSQPVWRSTTRGRVVRSPARPASFELAGLLGQHSRASNDNGEFAVRVSSTSRPLPSSSSSREAPHSSEARTPHTEVHANDHSSTAATNRARKCSLRTTSSLVTSQQRRRPRYPRHLLD
jgi:hypothetical protein